MQQEPKQKFEKDLTDKIAKAGKQAEYGNLLSDFAKNYAEIKEYAVARDYYTEVVLRNTEILSFGYKLFQLEQVFNVKGEQSFNDRKKNLIETFEPLYKDFNVQVDEKSFRKINRYLQ